MKGMEGLRTYEDMEGLVEGTLGLRDIDKGLEGGETLVVYQS